MEQKLYRDYSNWLLAENARLPFLRLDRASFRRWLAGLAGVFVFASLLLWQRMQVVKLGYQVATLQKQEQDLASGNQLLQRQLQDLNSLAHAEQVAREQLGMQAVNPRQVITLPSGQGSPFSPATWWRGLKGLFSR